MAGAVLNFNVVSCGLLGSSRSQERLATGERRHGVTRKKRFVLADGQICGERF